MEILKPCPFCGKQPCFNKDRSLVICGTDYCPLMSCFVDVRAWNTRAEDQPTDISDTKFGKSKIADPDYVAAQQAENARLRVIVDELAINPKPPVCYAGDARMATEGQDVGTALPSPAPAFKAPQEVWTVNVEVFDKNGQRIQKHKIDNLSREEMEAIRCTYFRNAGDASARKDEVTVSAVPRTSPAPDHPHDKPVVSIRGNEENCASNTGQPVELSLAEWLYVFEADRDKDGVILRPWETRPERVKDAYNQLADEAIQACGLKREAIELTENEYIEGTELLWKAFDASDKPAPFNQMRDAAKAFVVWLNNRRKS